MSRRLAVAGEAAAAGIWSSAPGWRGLPLPQEARELLSEPGS